jgi:hypothetical protein
VSLTTFFLWEFVTTISLEAEQNIYHSLPHLSVPAVFRNKGKDTQALVDNRLNKS